MNITIELPDDLANQAQRFDLLNSEAIASLLKAEVERRRDASWNRLMGKLERLQAVQPPITPEEIDAEIEAYRAEKREAGHQLVEMMKLLHTVQPPITPEEIDAEIELYRAEKRAAREQEKSNGVQDDG